MIPKISSSGNSAISNFLCYYLTSILLRCLSQQPIRKLMGVTLQQNPLNYKRLNFLRTFHWKTADPSPHWLSRTFVENNQ